MNKWHGKIGYGITKKTGPGVFKTEMTFRESNGDILRNTAQSDNSDKVNDDFRISGSISVVADAFINQNFQFIRCAEFMGAFWKVTKADVQYPRIVLTLGGIYNGKQA